MKIARAELAPFALELAEAVRTGRGAHSRREGFVVRLTDAEGRIGLGEATPLPSQGTEDLASCREALRSLSALVGAELDRADQVDVLLHRLPWISAPAARHAAELAFLDLLAQHHGLPIAGELAPDLHASVAVNALLTSDAPAELAKEAAARAAEGFETFKLKVGARATSEDLERARAVRQAIGARGRLRIDANGAWSLEVARGALPAFHQTASVELCEQPVAGLEDLATLSRESPIPLAADELLADPRAAKSIIERRAAAALVLKPMVLGGLRPALKLAAKAHVAGLSAFVTTSLDGAIARAAALHLACAMPGQLPACGLATGFLLASDLGEEPIRVIGGRVASPIADGLGVRLTAALDWERP